MLLAPELQKKEKTLYQSKRWTITFWPENAKKTPKEIYESSDMSFMIYGEEICPHTKKLHYQMYVEFEKRKTLGPLQELFGMGHYLRASKGNWKSNVKYTSKDGNVTTYGQPYTQGHNALALPAARDIFEGKRTWKEVIDDDFQMVHQYKNTMKWYINECRNEIKKNWKPKVVVRFGRTGTGKSKWVWDKYPDLYKYVYNNGNWWQGYTGQEIVMFEEFRGQLPFGFMLDLLDYYPVQVQQKGGDNVQFVAKKVFICSPVHPREWYKNMEDREGKIDQLLRRIDLIIDLSPRKELEEENVAEWELHN